MLATFAKFSKRISGVEDRVTTTLFKGFPRRHSSTSKENILLYKSKTPVSIQMMFASGCLNLVVWSQYLFNNYIYHDVVIEGINLGGGSLSSTWGMIGALGTGAIFYLTHSYASHSVSSSYLSADKKRIGFQLRNLIATPGRRIEVPLGNAKLLPSRNVFGSTMQVIRVEGLGKNLLLDPSGVFYDNSKLLTLLQSAEELKLDSKEVRVNWQKDEYQKQKRKERTV